MKRLLTACPASSKCLESPDWFGKTIFAPEMHRGVHTKAFSLTAEVKKDVSNISNQFQIFFYILKQVPIDFSCLGE